MVDTVLTPPVAESLTQQVFDYQKTIPARLDVLWQIERGMVRTSTWNEDGTTVVLGYWGPGDVVGSALSRIVPYQIDCITVVETTVFPYESWHKVLGAMLLHMQQIEEVMRIVQVKTVEQRLGQFLVWLAQKFGRQVDEGLLLDMPLTHQELAGAIGTTRVSVIRMLMQLETQGLLLRHKRKLVLVKNVEIANYAPSPTEASVLAPSR
ncbi:MAG: Crp/Fnr family transcriptional regulator [Chroococcidiopsidaceae cyanobacterium CP_BM_ER_R8_30]|nr:Crp/Fnr family transcriptional regulator [Chroococcidiopsidaceae cyanobacterium CP_BM_ER_R8_30]